MAQFKDPAIKLFGKTIPLPTEEEILVSDASATCKATIISASASLHDDRLSDHETSPPASSFKEKSSKQDDKKHSGEHTKGQDENGTSHQDSDAKETPKNGESNETSILQENTTKKPDKILACPRCNSMDTKFCYYNNYNVNQPRHFCKNCQRYWTAGGTMRNVPVGAGRRKNKHSSASHYRHIMVSEALQSARTNAAAAELTTPVTTASYSIDKGCRAGSQEPLIKNFQGVHPQVQRFPAPPWPYPWNSAMPPPAFYPPGFPVSFCSAPNFHSVSGSWPSNLWFSLPPTSPNHSSRFNSPTLGKHSREEEEVLRENDEERGIWIPKSLRIDDPSEAAKSSIWATLGIKNHEKTSSINGGGFFKAFLSKAGEKNHIADTSPVLQANPAALSRSLNFHENS